MEINHPTSREQIIRKNLREAKNFWHRRPKTIANKRAASINGWWDDTPRQTVNKNISGGTFFSVQRGHFSMARHAVDLY